MLKFPLEIRIFYWLYCIYILVFKGWVPKNYIQYPKKSVGPKNSKKKILIQPRFFFQKIVNYFFKLCQKNDLSVCLQSCCNCTYKSSFYCNYQTSNFNREYCQNRLGNKILYDYKKEIVTEFNTKKKIINEFQDLKEHNVSF